MSNLAMLEEALHHSTIWHMFRMRALEKITRTTRPLHEWFYADEATLGKAIPAPGSGPKP